MAIFNSYVKLPEGKHVDSRICVKRPILKGHSGTFNEEIPILPFLWKQLINLVWYPAIFKRLHNELENQPICNR